MRIAIAIVVLFVFASATGRACSCGKYPSAGEARESATVVFEGTVVERWPELIPMNVPSYERVEVPSQRYTFAISRIWKGASQRHLTTLEGSGNCSNLFETGKTYLVFASQHETEIGSLESHKCGGPTVEASLAHIHIAQLGRPIVTFPPTSTVRSSLLYRAKQHAAVYFWTGTAVLNFALRRPSEIEWQIALGLLTVLAATLSLAFAIKRKVASASFRVFGVLLTILAGTLVGIIATGVYYIRTNHWYQHLLEGWSSF